MTNTSSQSIKNTVRVVGALAAGFFFVANAEANQFGLGPVQAPNPNSVPNIQAPAPAPTPNTQGWVRPIPIPSNPGVMGGFQSGNTKGNFTIRKHNYEIGIQHKLTF